MRREDALAAVCVLMVTTGSVAQQPEPIIDMHLHTTPPGEFLPAKPYPIECALPSEFPSIDPRNPGDLGGYFESQRESCGVVLEPVQDEEELIRDSVARLDQYNIVALATGREERLEKWRRAAPARILAAEAPLPWTEEVEDRLRRRASRGELRAVAELSAQYAGLSPADPALAPLFAMAEELDLPVGIHMGLSAPGVPALGFKGYRPSQSSPLLLEEVLLRHPSLRVYVMHAGWPMLDDMLHMLYSFPQLYVDVAVINWVLPRTEFHRYLRRLVEAGFGSRIMWGSDQMIWPQAIDVGIESIESAGFLSEQQRRDIFFNNAARFLRLSDEEIAGLSEEASR